MRVVAQPGQLMNCTEGLPRIPRFFSPQRRQGHTKIHTDKKVAENIVGNYRKGNEVMLANGWATSRRTGSLAWRGSPLPILVLT